MLLPENGRALLIRLSAMGDVLFSLETLSSLVTERPDVTVDFLVEDRFAGLIEGHPYLDRVLVYPRRRKRAIPAAIRRLRAHRYDVVLDLHGNLKSAVHAKLARGDHKLGYAPPIAREHAHRLYNGVVELPTPRPHRAEQGYYLLRALGLTGARARPVLPPSSLPSGAPSEAPFEAPFRAPNGSPASAPESGLEGRGSPAADVILHLGTSAFARFKRWPTPRFAELARRLTARGLRVAVSIGPGEEALDTAVRAHAPEVGRVNGAALGLAGLGEAYGRARVVVAADTGPLHLAAAAGTPVVALFGPKDARLYGPRGPGHHIAFHGVPCRPCRRRNCDSPQCMLGLQVDAVESAVLEVCAPRAVVSEPNAL